MGEVFGCHWFLATFPKQKNEKVTLRLRTGSGAVLPCQSAIKPVHPSGLSEEPETNQQPEIPVSGRRP